MSSRENILKAALENQPAFVALPQINLESVINYENLAAQFDLILTRIGGTVEHFEDEASLLARMASHSPEEFVINTITADAEGLANINKMNSVQLEAVDVAYVRGALGVAENGAVWMDENAMVNRLLPFICQHLVVVLKVNEIVPTMHHAYQKIEVNKTGFGSFIAGPSKTADIEQSLVIGAHGPRSLTLLLQF
ncbi:LUD domain-containing protein [Pedobacter sp. MC2016-14]|uniref:LutC/YkgG family protein n=1 Tax=Pedobacter sp. MC2016-14 TaxID=2897327 RepID=UPI001E386C73|nr:LUD domain-containing protein [Pedobacter sp. MC2016-14]MCD0488949.1 LUD domain-containing protein [Pedobacter sp. MC2016-14]